MEIKHKARIQNGKIVLENNRLWGDVLGNLDGEVVMISIKKWFKNRTEAQNNYYFGVLVQSLMDYSNSDKDEVHAFLANEFLKTEKVILGKNVTQVASTAKLNTKEFNEYIEKVRVFLAQEYAITTPDPEY